MPLPRLFAGETVARGAYHRALLAHLVAKLATLTVGAAYVSRPVGALKAWLDQRSPRPRFSGRAALVAHAFYPELVDEILACHAAMPAGSDLILTAPREQAAVLRSSLGDGPAWRVVDVPNRGRDIAPFLRLLNDGTLDGYDAVLKLHTKRSPNLRDGDIRRRLLFAALAGSRGCVGRVLALFEDGSTGLVGWRACWRRSPIYWMSNRQRAEHVAARLGIRPPPAPAFFEGSMFWLRPAAVSALKRLRLGEADFEAEAGQTDGALHHALERLFAPVASDSGYAVLDTFGRPLLPPATRHDGERRASIA